MLKKRERDKLAKLYEASVKMAQRWERAPLGTQSMATAHDRASAAEKAFYDYLDALSEPQP